MSFVQGTNHILVIHPKAPLIRHSATLDFKTASYSVITFALLTEEYPDWLGEDRLDILQIVSPEAASLINLQSVSKDVGSRGAILSFQVELIVTGVHVLSPEIELTELTLRIDGCAQWFGIHGFKETSCSNDRKYFHVKYDQPEDFRWSLDVRLTFLYGRDLQFYSSTRPERSVTLTESSRLTVQVEEARTFEDLLKQLFKVIRFLEFLSGEAVRIESVFGRNGADCDEVEFSGAWKQTQSTPIGPRWFTFFQVVEANFGDHLRTWFRLYEKLPIALDLYQVCKSSSNLAIEFRFFGIVSALEALHNSLFQQDVSAQCRAHRSRSRMSLEQRLREIVHRGPPQIELLLPSNDCKKIADTRNFLAHQTRDLQQRSIPSEEWYFWYRRLSAVFEFSILAQLPFQAPDALANILARRMRLIKSGSLGEWNL